MNFNDNLPIYIQIMEYIKKQIVTGKLKGGEKLPSVRELSSELKVNPNTIQRSYAELERENLVFTQRGMGTFVTEDAEMIKGLKRNMAAHVLNSFLKEMKAIGFSHNDIIELINESVKEEE